MAVVAGAFFDTTLLLSGLIDMGPPSAAAQRVMDAVARGRISKPATAWHCCLEFFAVSTRLPEDLRLTPANATTLIREEILARFRVHELADGDRLSLVELAAAERVLGGRVYDLHIAEVARLANAQLVVTDNRRHFSSLMRHGIRVLSAVELADEVLI